MNTTIKLVNEKDYLKMIEEQKNKNMRLIIDNIVGNEHFLTFTDEPYIEKRSETTEQLIERKVKELVKPEVLKNVQL
jgi:hypothetical protein